MGLPDGRRFWTYSAGRGRLLPGMKRCERLHTPLLWLPDPSDPQNASLEGRLWHPLFLARVAAVFTAHSSYTHAFLEEIKTYAMTGSRHS